MLNIRDFVPKAYSSSRDYLVFLRLLDMIINCSKSEVDNMINLLNPDKCPDNLLKCLASNVGYAYDQFESYDRNRIIIKYYPQLIRNRGNETGYGLAIALAMNTSDSIEDTSFMEMFRIDYEYIKDSDGSLIVDRIIVYVYYPGVPSKLYDLIEVVRPAGVKFKVVPAKQVTTLDKIEVYDYVRKTGDEILKESSRYKITGYNLDKDGKPISKTEDNPYSETGEKITVEDFKNKNRIGFGEVHNENEDGNE